MGKCYNVVLDSTLAYSGGATLATLNYFVNWAAIMPNKPYKVTFSFVSAVALLTGTVVMGIKANLGTNMVFAPEDGATPSSLYLGTAHSSDMAALHYMNASFQDNPPLYINERPNQNLLTILLTNGATNLLYTTPNPAEYVLILNFEEQ